MKLIKQIIKILQIVINLAILAVMTNSCETHVGEPVYTGEEYFNLTEGKWVVYQVDSIVYDDFLGEEFVYSYQVKEYNNGLFYDSQGLPKMRIERFIRKETQHNWQIKNIWTAALYTNRAMKTEENVTFVKLSFPLKRNLSWNGNLFNTKAAQLYKITRIHEPYQMPGLEFDSTLTVLQRDFTTLIGKEYQFEVYATGVGMISKKYIALETEIDGNIIRGVDYSYNLIDYGFGEQ
jgi:hypothetical protein